MKHSKPKLSLSLMFISHQINCDQDKICQAYCSLTLKQIRSGIDAWINNPTIKKQMLSLITHAENHFNSSKSSLSRNQTQRLLYEIQYMKQAINTNSITELVGLTKQKDSDIAKDQADKDKEYPYQFEISHKAIMLSRKNFEYFNILQFYGIAAHEFMLLNTEEKANANELTNLLNNQGTNATKLQDVVNNYDEHTKDQKLIDEMNKIKQGTIKNNELQNFGEIKKNLENWKTYTKNTNAVLQTQQLKTDQIGEFKNRQRRYVSYILLNRIRQQIQEAPNTCVKNNKSLQKQIDFALEQAKIAQHNNHKNPHITDVIKELNQLKLPSNSQNASQETLFYFREYQKIMELSYYTQYGIIKESGDINTWSVATHPTNQQLTQLEQSQLALFLNKIKHNTKFKQIDYTTQNNNKNRESQTQRNTIIGVTIVISIISIAAAIYLWKKNLNKTKNNV